MRTLVVTLGILLLGATEAHAQFANRSLGISGGYMVLNGTDALENAVTFGLTGSLYIESGFDAVAHFGMMIVKDQLVGGQYVVGISPSLGIRYLFLEESIRPYVGLSLSYLGVFRIIASNYVGISPNVGADFFVSDTVSLGVRVASNIYLTLNRPTQLSLEGQFNVSTYF